MSATVWDEAVSCGKPGGPADGIDRPRQQRHGQRFDGLAELFPRHGVRLSLVRNVGKRFA